MEYYLQITLGLIVLIGAVVPLSTDIKAIRVKNILAAIAVMVLFGFILLNDYVAGFFEVISAGVAKLSSATADGTSFVFGSLFEQHPFAFALNVLPLIIVMSTLSALLWHWRVLPMVIKGLSYVCEKLFNLGGPISFGAAANVFVGQVEAPLFVKPYLSKMSKKELLILMTAGMATVAGSVMIALITVLENKFIGINLIQHFITASILSIPAAIMYANILIPSNEVTDFSGEETPRIYKNTMDAITRGTSDGTSIAISVGAILIAFIALVYFANSFLGMVSGWIGYPVSIEMILGYIFAPIAWLMGIPWGEAIIAGELLGIKTTLNEFVAYYSLSSLEEGALSDRSRLITLYGLCGFANFSSVGILVSGISAMAPERKTDLIEVSFKALIGATLASCMTGLVVGCFI